MRKVMTFVAVALAAVLGAQAADIQQKSTLTLDGVRRVAAAAVAEAAREGGTGAIAIVDDGGQLVWFERLDGTFPAGSRIAIGKARTAALFRKPTRVFESIIKNGRTPMVALDDFTPLDGGVPLEIGGQVVGAIGVSGAASQQRDDEIAVAGAKAASALAGAAAAAAAGPAAGAASGPAGPSEPVSPAAMVTAIDDSRVRAAFSKGEPLLETGDYKIHASHRNAPGKAEIHTRDTDIIYVVSGTATLVTGGRVPDPAPIGPEELRGTAIEGGESRSLAPGDVVVVPSGVPHWFRAVPGRFDYFVVKVRS